MLFCFVFLLQINQKSGRKCTRSPGTFEVVNLARFATKNDAIWCLREQTTVGSDTKRAYNQLRKSLLTPTIQRSHLERQLLASLRADIAAVVAKLKEERRLRLTK